jgi:hypothetical protein
VLSTPNDCKKKSPFTPPTRSDKKEARMTLICTVSDGAGTAACLTADRIALLHFVPVSNDTLSRSSWRRQAMATSLFVTVAMVAVVAVAVAVAVVAIVAVVTVVPLTVLAGAPSHFAACRQSKS